MKRLALLASTLLLCSCQTAVEPPVNKDFTARAAADIDRYRVADNSAYGYEPEGRFDPSARPVQGTFADGAWKVYQVTDTKAGFDRVEVTVDDEGTILRLRFIKPTFSSVARRDTINSVYEELRHKYKVMERIGDNDTAELTVYVANDDADWIQHRVQYLQLMDEPNHLGAQDCWILQPHLSLVQVTIKRQEGAGALIVVDYQTKKYAAGMAVRAAEKVSHRKPSSPGY